MNTKYIYYVAYVYTLLISILSVVYSFGFFIFSGIVLGFTVWIFGHMLIYKIEKLKKKKKIENSKFVNDFNNFDNCKGKYLCKQIFLSKYDNIPKKLVLFLFIYITSGIFIDILFKLGFYILSFLILIKGFTM